MMQEKSFTVKKNIPVVAPSMESAFQEPVEEQGSGSGKVWYGERRIALEEYWVPSLMFSRVRPSGEDIRNVREAEINLSGLFIYFRIGFGF